MYKYILTEQGYLRSFTILHTLQHYNVDSVNSFGGGF